MLHGPCFFLVPLAIMTPLSPVSTVSQSRRLSGVIAPAAIQTSLLAALLALTVLVYSPGLSGGFLFDDMPNIVDNDSVHLEALTFADLRDAALSVHAVHLSRPVSMVSFALNYWATGLDPFYFKLTNLVIHLINGVLLYLLTRTLLAALRWRGIAPPTQPTWLALIIAAAWLLHPLNMSATLYVVQRMASLAALFTFSGLLFYALGRLRQQDGRGGTALIALSLLLCGPLAILSKENGALLPFMLFVLEATFFRFKAQRITTRRGVIAFQSVAAVLPALFILGYLATHLDWLREMYTTRDFTLEERLLTQARVLFFYLRLILVPDISAMGLYHDDIALSHSLMDPPITLAAVLGMAVLVAIAVAAKRRAPVLSFGIVFFLVGHSMESSVLSLEIAHEHRNYMPSYAIIFCLFYFLLSGASSATSRRLRLIAVVTLLLFLAGTSAVRASYWGNSEIQATIEAHNHPYSARSLYELGRYYFDKISADPQLTSEFYPKARELFERTPRLDEYNPSGLFALIQLNGLVGLPPEQEWLDDLQRRLRETPIAQFVVAMLSRLNECHQLHQCKTITNQQMENLFNAALVNPTLPNWMRARLLADLAAHAMYAQNFNAALGYARAALAYEPKYVQHYLNLASVLFQVGQITAARKELAIAEDMPLSSKERERFASLQAAIGSAQAKEEAKSSPPAIPQ